MTKPISDQGSFLDFDKTDFFTLAFLFHSEKTLTFMIENGMKFKYLLDGIVDWPNTGGMTDATVALHKRSSSVYLSLIINCAI